MLWKLPTSAGRLEFLARRVRSGAFGISVLAIVGLAYYGSFYNYVFRWTDEGAVALIAERLAMGERPYVDFEPGYGVLWHYPIALLFKVFGVHFNVVRIYFLCISFASALLARALLSRLTGSRPFALAVALLVLLLGGTIHKSYIPFLVICGAYVLFLYDARTLKAAAAPWSALAASGIFIGLAFLVRGDIATVYAALFILYHGSMAWQAAARERSPAKLLILPARGAVVALVAMAVAVPFAIQAHAGGYLAEFTRQYSQFAVHLFSRLQAAASVPSGSGSAVAGTLLARPGILSVFSQPQWVFLTYAPVCVLISIGLYLCRDFFGRGANLRAVAGFLSDRTHLVVLSIGAFSAFPQFFLFRPDVWHLSQFAPGFFVLSAYFLHLLADRCGAAAGTAPVRRWGSYLFGAFCLLYVAAFADRYDDGFRFRRDRDQRFRVEGRIDSYLSRSEYRLLDQLNTRIRKASRPGEYVLCFPYCPGINFVTARRTFQHYLYVDDSFLVLRPDWMEQMQAQIAAKKPKVIVVWNWDTNRTEISRFPVWAAPLYRFIGENYALEARITPGRGSNAWYEVYVLR